MTVISSIPSFTMTSQSKKGLSAEEKSAKLLTWFHTTREFFSIKEVEKQGSKATGIAGMVIKEWVAFHIRLFCIAEVGVPASCNRSSMMDKSTKRRLELRIITVSPAASEIERPH